jgi:hypothetical protein
MNCKKCNKSHNGLFGSGIYCSRSCANSRIRTQEIKDRVSKKMLGHYIKTISVCPCGKEIICYSKISRIPHKYCSIKCSSKYIDHRKIINIKEYKNYGLRCDFIFKLSDYPNKFDFELIKKYGWYHPKNRGDNLNGVSRDHIVSVRYGFENSIPPEIISHPANCQLMRHRDNSSKHSKCGMTIEELKEKIQNWEV